MNIMPQRIIEEWITYLNEMYNNAHSSMLKKELEMNNVHAFLRHLPNRNIEGWSEEIYQLADNFLKELYQYSKEMGYI